jgi:hypothetical protein
MPGSDKTPQYPATEDGLWQAFFDTDEMYEYIAATDKIHAAQKRGDTEVALPTAFLARVIANRINFDDPEIVAAWNRCCDLVGLPDKKEAQPGPSPGETRTLHDVTATPIRFKERPKNETGDEEDGPF